MLLMLQVATSLDLKLHACSTMLAQPSSILGGAQPNSPIESTEKEETPARNAKP